MSKKLLAEFLGTFWLAPIIGALAGFAHKALFEHPDVLPAGAAPAE